MLKRLQDHSGQWDFIIVGGGATGVGIAIDAVTRGYDVLLLEQSDFGKGTSSRSTKLVHGGVRYLEQGNLSLVMEALKERGLLLQNAPHLVRNLGFVVPTYQWWESPFYGAGLKLYNLLAGKYGFGASRILSKEQTLEHLPALDPEGLRGGVIYFDGQFDDSRLLINLVATASEHGATLLNYAEVKGFTTNSQGMVDGVTAYDSLNYEDFEARAKVVINATGPFSDIVRRLADRTAPQTLALSKGIHIVLDRDFLAGDSAIMVPHTADKRVMFAIPWHGHTLVGTTDTPLVNPEPEPLAFDTEVEFVLSTAARYFAKKPTTKDVRSVFAGIRPLVRSDDSKNTAALSREHTIRIEDSGLLTMCGGKWTTYRRMAEDCVNQAAALAKLPERDCVTHGLKIHGHDADSEQYGHLSVYGSDAPAVRRLMSDEIALSWPLNEALPYTGAEVVFGVREEMAMTLEDVLARRTRALFLNARAALDMAPRVAELMARELGQTPDWQEQQVGEFTDVACGYLMSSEP